MDLKVPAEDMSDAELINLYIGGSIAAMEMLVMRHKASVFGYIMNITGSRQAAEDAFQETWIRAMRKMGSFRDRNFPGWLMRIARNYIIDEARKRKPELSLDCEQDGGLSFKSAIAASGPAPDRSVASKELAGRIAAALDSLPLEQKEVFVLRVQANLPFKDICRIQKTSINTALARMQYALARLRSLLKDEYVQIERTI